MFHQHHSPEGCPGSLEELNPRLFSFLKSFEAKERKGLRPTGTPSRRDPQTPPQPGGRSLSWPMPSQWTRGRTQAADALSVSPASRERAQRRGIQRGRAHGSRTCLQSHVSASKLQGHPLRPQNTARRKQRGGSVSHSKGQEELRATLRAGSDLGTPRSPLSPPGSLGSLLPRNFRDLELAVLMVCSFQGRLPRLV